MLKKILKEIIKKTMVLIISLPIILISSYYFYISTFPIIQNTYDEILIASLHYSKDKHIIYKGYSRKKENMMTYGFKSEYNTIDEFSNIYYFKLSEDTNVELVSGDEDDFRNLKISLVFDNELDKCYYIYNGKTRKLTFFYTKNMFDKKTFIDEFIMYFYKNDSYALVFSPDDIGKYKYCEVLLDE